MKNMRSECRSCVCLMAHGHSGDAIMEDFHNLEILPEQPEADRRTSLAEEVQQRGSADSDAAVPKRF